MSIGAFVPKPHTPFQWASQCDHETVDARLAALRQAVRSDRKYAKAVGFPYHDGKPSQIEGLLSRGGQLVGSSAYGLGGRCRFDGWSNASYERWVAAATTALAGELVDLNWYTTREQEYAEVHPGPPRCWPGSGVAVGGLAGRGG